MEHTEQSEQSEKSEKSEQSALTPDAENILASNDNDNEIKSAENEPMMFSLENDKLRIEVSRHGAEMRRLTEKADGTEYLHDGDPTWWKYTSPVLFPIVGKLNENTYRVDGEEFTLPSHGFGRTSDFFIATKSSNSLKFYLDWSSETYEQYPFRFRLIVGYSLEGNAVKITWRVMNIDIKPIFFSIGAHPALRCPIVKGEDITDCYLSFETTENAEKYAVTSDAFLVAEKVPGFSGDRQDLSWEFFAKGTWIFDNLASKRVTIRSKKSEKFVAVEAPDFPFWAFWSPEKGGAPFICIEPWYGHADFAGYTGEFSAKHGVQTLPIGGIFDTSYKIITSA